MNKSELSSLLKKYNVRPSRERGQNFLIDDSIIKKTISTACLEKNDVVLEIGAGFGNLTAELAKKVQQVVALEPDSKIFPALKSLASSNTNIFPINQGVFDVDFTQPLEIEGANTHSHLQFHDYSFKIVSNLPYQITSHFLKHFLQYGPRPKSMCIMVQKEVAQRICAKVGQKSILSLSVELYSNPEIAFFVSKKSFFPTPKVDSAILVLPEIKPKYNLDEEDFFRILKIGFSAKRKKLINNLENGLRLGKNEISSLFQKLGFDPNIRAQNLSLENWVKLFDSISKI